MSLKEKEYYVTGLSVKKTGNYNLKVNLVKDVDLCVAELKKKIKTSCIHKEYKERDLKCDCDDIIYMVTEVFG